MSDTDILAGLTVKQRRFVEAFAGPARGNATEAASLAGYKGNRATLGQVGDQNLKKPKIAAALADLAQAARAGVVADGLELRTFFTNCVRNTLPDGRDVKTVESIQAGTTLAKMQGLFLDPAVHLAYLMTLRPLLAPEDFGRLLDAYERRETAA